MSDASWAVQRGVYAVLRDDVDLQNLLGTPARIYDDVPEEVLFPYLTLGEVRTKAWSGVPGGQEHDLRLHAWSRYGGRREIKEIMSAVYAALHDEDFPVDGVDLVNCRYVFADMWLRPDNETYHGVMRYRIVTSPTLN
jgi:hypothetical protein